MLFMIYSLSTIVLSMTYSLPSVGTYYSFGVGDDIIIITSQTLGQLQWNHLIYSETTSKKPNQKKYFISIVQPTNPVYKVQLSYENIFLSTKHGVVDLPEPLASTSGLYMICTS